MHPISHNEIRHDALACKARESSPEAGEAAPRDDGSARGREVAPFASLESELNISWSSVTDRTVLGCPGVDGK